MRLQAVWLQMRRNACKLSQSSLHELEQKQRETRMFFLGSLPWDRVNVVFLHAAQTVFSKHFFFSLPIPCPPTLQIIKKQKSKTEQAEADFEWPPSRSSGLASVAVSDQSMLTFPGSRRGSYTLWVSDLAQLLMFSAAQNWKTETMDKYTYCLEWYVATCREQALNMFLGKLSLSCMLS